MAIVNKDLIQSYIMTTAKYDFNVYEKRIIYRLVEMAQGELQGIKFADNCQKIEHDLFSCVNITMPIACLLNGEDDKNYARVKEALQSLQRKIFEYEDDEIWQSISIIALPYIRKRSSVLSFQVHPRVWDCILDFSKGFRKYELKAAMSFKSQFSMRFYELLSNQKTPLIYSIEQLKEMFCVTDKYERINDFIRYVVDAAKKELDEVSPYTFEYTPLKTGRKITAIKFYPVYQPEHRDSDLEKHDLQKQTALSWSLAPEIRSYLKNSIEFSDKEIKNNLDLFISAQTLLPDFLNELAILKGKSREKKNPKGYIINAIKGKIKDRKKLGCCHTIKKNKDMKEGDLILVSAEATGLGKPMEAIIDKIETFMGQTLVTVTYTQPDALSGFGGCFVDSHITLSEKKTK